jgi:putative ABC transport system permease protein
MLGRAFLSEEGLPGKNHVAVLSYDLWREHFASDSAVLNKTVLLNGIQYTIVGVMGPNFSYPSGALVWAALAFSPEEKTSRAVHYLRCVAHLAAGTNLGQAQAEMSNSCNVIRKPTPDVTPTCCRSSKTK